MIRTHVVLRPFQAEGREVLTGDQVDASGWKNTERLVSTKYLRPLTDADRAQAKRSVKPVAKPAPSPKKFFVKRSKK